MEITRSNNKTAYEEYEQLLLERDSLYKEKESIYVMYIHEFGDLLVERFHSQINIICTKKSIAFCQAKINRGWIVCLSELNSFIDIEMQGYNDKLSCMIDQNESCRRLTRLSKDENQRIKRIYRKLARLLHPDLNPDIENETWLSDLWERISTAYINNTDQVYKTVEQLKENVQPSEAPSVLECDYKEKTCDAYYLGEDGTKVGAVRYIYRYNDSNIRISKSGNNVFTEYTYDKGRLTSIIDYEGTEKSASSVAFHTVEFGYNNDNKATYVKVTDTTTETKSSFDYTLEYDDQGRAVKTSRHLYGIPLDSFYGFMGGMQLDNRGMYAVITVNNQNDENVIPFFNALLQAGQGEKEEWITE